MDISQGSAAMHLRCGGKFNDDFIANLLMSVNERIEKIGYHFAKLGVFLSHCVHDENVTRASSL